jgi:trimeric autotransporter adhesin
VSACTGVSLPKSVVTNITGQVLTPVLAPVESILGTLTFGTVNLGLPGALSNAASGAPINLSAIDINGNAIDVLSDPTCQTNADSFGLTTPKGISFGGNKITGLGTTGLEASAGELDAIAIGDLATTSVGANGAIAIGAGAMASHSGSVALGANSSADGTTLGHAAYLLGGTATAEVNIGNRRITGVAAGADATDAVNVAQLSVVNDALTDLADLAVTYDSSAKSAITLQGASGTRISNVADGVAAHDAVNMGQLNALAVDVDALRDDALLFDAMAGAYNARRGGVDQRITGVANGVAGNDAVNLSQLNAVAQTANNSVQYDGPAQDSVTLGGAAGTRVTNVAAGAVNASSTDAVNGSQLHATNQAVTQIDQKVQTLATNVATHLGGGSIVNPNGSVSAPTYTLTSIDNGGNGSVNVYHNVGDALDGLSTSITNVNQRLDDVASVSDRAVVYDGAAGTAKDRITLAGAAGTTLTNLKDGEVSATSTDAVTGAQLHATNVQLAYNVENISNVQNGVDGYFQVNNSSGRAKPVPGGADSAAAGAGAVASGRSSVAFGTDAQASADNSVAIGSGSIADRANSVSIGSVGNERQITSVAAATSATDAVNLGQLQAGMTQATNVANAYTDMRIDQLGFDLKGLRRDAEGGTASAMAVAGIPQTIDPGAGMLGFGASTWQGERAFAMGFSKASDNGRVIVRAAASVNTRGQGGANAGVGFAF